MDYPFYAPIYLSMFVISIVTDCATFKQREAGNVMDVSLKAIVMSIITTTFFIFLYYILPASLVVICIRWISGLRPLPGDNELAYLDAVMKTALLICMADNYADMIAFKPEFRMGFLGYILSTLFLFPLGFFATMAFCLGYLRVFFENSISIASTLVFNIAFVSDLGINRLLAIVLLLIFGVVSYGLMKFRQPEISY